jgi:hypothetical protein
MVAHADANLNVLTCNVAAWQPARPAAYHLTSQMTIVKRQNVDSLRNEKINRFYLRNIRIIMKMPESEKENVLSRRLNKILETRLENDQVIIYVHIS